MNIKTIIVAIALTALAGCAQAPAPAVASAASTPPPPPRVGSQWKYGVNKDPMTDDKTMYATVSSTNTVNFAFPYSGAQHATLQLVARIDNKALLYLEKGQFMCAPQGCVVRVRFDDSPVIDYTGQSLSDGDNTVLIIRDTPTSFETTDKMSEYASDDSFSGLLLKAKEVRISTEVYQEGSPTFVFDVRGLNHDKSGLTCLGKAALAEGLAGAPSKHLSYEQQQQASNAVYNKANQKCIEQQQ